jgi:hypothetical protein
MAVSLPFVQSFSFIHLTPAFPRRHPATPRPNSRSSNRGRLPHLVGEIASMRSLPSFSQTYVLRGEGKERQHRRIHSECKGPRLPHLVKAPPYRSSMGLHPGSSAGSCLQM